MSATATLGLLLLWDVDGGLTQIDKYLYSSEDFIKVGSRTADPRTEEGALCSSSLIPFLQWQHFTYVCEVLGNFSTIQYSWFSDIFVVVVSIIVSICCVQYPGWGSAGLWRGQLWSPEWMWPGHGPAVRLRGSQLHHHKNWGCGWVRADSCPLCDFWQMWCKPFSW